MSAVVVEHLTRRYGSFTAVDDVSFAIDPGQVTALLGPNGAGKTTVIEILEGLLAPSAGTVRVLGADPRRGGRAWRACVGLVLQSTSLDRQLTVSEVLAAYAAVYPRAMPVAATLELVGLTGDAHTRIGALSGGQRRRVDLALGMVGRPDVLFLDEPTTGLDPQARRQVWGAVRALVDHGSTVLLTTHYLDEAQQLADRVIMLAAGRVVADASPDELRSRAAPPIIRLPLPAGAPVGELPASLARHLRTGRDTDRPGDRPGGRDTDRPGDRPGGGDTGRHSDRHCGGDGDRYELVLASTDVTGDLAALVGWASRAGVDLAALQVGPPSLEEAYLHLTGTDGHPEPKAGRVP